MTNRQIDKKSIPISVNSNEVSKGNYANGKYPKGKCLKGKCPKGKCPKGKCPKGKCPKCYFSYWMPKLILYSLFDRKICCYVCLSFSGIETG